MNTPKAADMQAGSVVADGMDVWVKADDGGAWRHVGDMSMVVDYRIQGELDNGAKVLRIGDGQ